LLLFRFFDIVKPFPVSWLDTHLHGGIGIMMDDVAAGIYALICLQVIWRVVERFL
jgi:phosphatidylglycerophosphatase A